MKKWKIIILGIILLFIIDLICIFIFHRPIFAIKEDNGDSVDIIYRGILYDTYNCHDESLIQITYKKSKFNCSKNIKIKEFVNYDFKVIVSTPNEYKKKYAFTYNDRDFYYGNTDFRLYLYEGNYEYDLETSLKNNLVSFDDILSKNKNINSLWDGGSKIYHYHQFNIIVCNTLDGNNDIIIGDTEMKIDNYCK
ncbi:MAG: hypothetical protein IJZ79_07120 [Bacilli bacterium]|nr:hypothetical protein [Bacilli bacterium]